LDPFLWLRASSGSESKLTYKLSITGKTSLVKTLSTLLSTAALDKSKQSRQRGMTLDLGFSCFFLDLPPHLKEAYPEKDKLQIT
jgi:selenocysteine-specific elongation factor